VAFLTRPNKPLVDADFNHSEVADLTARLDTLLHDPTVELTPGERQEWEHVLATAKRLADRFDVPK
jgi:hypothetical protein